MITTMKKLIQSFLKNILGIQILRVKKEGPQKEKPQLKMNYSHDPAYSYMIEPAYQEKLYLELAGVIETFLSNKFFPFSADVTKARDLLNWDPVVPLREGIEKTVQWYLNEQTWAKEIKT